jgi:hypothetical protein
VGHVPDREKHAGMTEQDEILTHSLALILGELIKINEHLIETLVILRAQEARFETTLKGYNV